MTSKMKEKLESILQFYNEAIVLESKERPEVLKKAFEISKEVGILTELLLDCSSKGIPRSKTNLLLQAKEHRGLGQYYYTNKKVNDFVTSYYEYIKENKNE